MWGQKKGDTPQVYPNIYGQPSGGHPGQQIPQPGLQHQAYQGLPYQSMSPSMGQSMGAGLAQGLGPPPPYSPYPEASQQQMKQYMQQMAYQNQYMAATNPSLVPQPPSAQVPPNPHSYPNPYASSPYHNPGLYPYNPYQNLGANGTVVLPQGFDAGARFDGVSRPGIPPAPPGVAPSAAQMAALQGQNVVIGQKKSSFLEGGSSGGYTFW